MEICFCIQGVFTLNLVKKTKTSQLYCFSISANHSVQKWWFVGSCLHAAGKGRKILNRLLTYVIVFILCGKC